MSINVDFSDASSGFGKTPTKMKVKLQFQEIFRLNNFLGGNGVFTKVAVNTVSWQRCLCQGVTGWVSLLQVIKCHLRDRWLSCRLGGLHHGSECLGPSSGSASWLHIPAQAHPAREWFHSDGNMNGGPASWFQLWSSHSHYRQLVNDLVNARFTCLSIHLSNK